MAASRDTQSNAEYILQFKETFDLRTFVQTHLTPDSNKEPTSRVLNARIVGQEGDGRVLLSWDWSDGDVVLTKVGSYASAQGKPVFQELYKHNERVDICSATVNSTLTLLAFTVKEEEKDVGETSYVSFCAEIQPQGRAFNVELSCDRFSFRKLQFLPLGLAPPKSTPRHTRHQHQVQPSASCQCYTSRLLVIVPSAFIVTYSAVLQQTVTVTPSGAVVHTGTVLLDFNEDKTPVTPHLLDWYQWDPKQQWLYYARLDTKPNLLLLSCMAFTSDPFEQVLSLCLPLPYPSERYRGAKGVGGATRGGGCPPEGSDVVPGVDLITPAHCLNLQVIYRRKEDHMLCVCVQHRTTDDPSLASDQDYTPMGEESVEYSVYMIHNGHVIHGLVPYSALPSRDLRVHFMAVGKFVAVYVPGVMLHLLNVHPQVDPCHHLVLDASMAPPLPTTPSPTPTPSAPTFPVLCNVVSIQSNFDSTSVMECRSQTILECALCPGALLGMFKSTPHVSQRVDLLHLAIVSLRLQNLALSMVEHVCQSPITLNTYQVFAEFILAFAYNNTLVSHVPRFITNQLPLTTTWPSFNGGVYRNEGGTTYAHLKIAQIEETFAKRLLVMVQVSQHKMDSPEDLLQCKFASEGAEAVQDMLYFNVITTAPKLKRLKINSLLDQQTGLTPGRGAGGGGAAVASKRFGHQFTIKRIMGAVREAVGNRRPVRQSAATGLPFLDPDLDLDPLVTAATQNLKTLLVNAIGSQLGSSSKTFVSEQLDTFYILELERESCELLKVIWQSLGLGRDTHPLNNTLYRKATPMDHVLFDLLEAYFHAHLDLCIPVPSGFHTLYTCLGFMCLEPMLVLQHFARGTFLATANFVEKAVQSSDDARLVEKEEEEDGGTARRDELLYNIICELTEPERTRAFARWNHPVVKLMVTAAQEEGR